MKVDEPGLTFRKLEARDEWYWEIQSRNNHGTIYCASGTTKYLFVACWYAYVAYLEGHDA